MFPPLRRMLGQIRLKDLRRASHQGGAGPAGVVGGGPGLRDGGLRAGSAQKLPAEDGAVLPAEGFRQESASLAALGVEHAEADAALFSRFERR